MSKSLQLLAILILSVTAPSLCRAKPAGSECGFSRHKPLVISHPLLDAAIKKVEPTWPPMGHGNSRVKVKILVDRKGDVVKACVVEGHPLLRESARQAALAWKFKPNLGSTAKQRRKYIQSHIVFIFTRE